MSMLLDTQREGGRRTSLTSLVKAVATARSVASPCKKPGVHPSTSSASQPHSAVHGALTYCAHKKGPTIKRMETVRTTKREACTSMKNGSWHDVRKIRSCRRNTSLMAMAGRFTKFVK